jgi:hypothetical protein
MKQLNPSPWTDFSGILLEPDRSSFFVTLPTLADGIFFTRLLENIPKLVTKLLTRNALCVDSAQIRHNGRVSRFDFC